MRSWKRSSRSVWGRAPEDGLVSGWSRSTFGCDRRGDLADGEGMGGAKQQVDSALLP